MIVLRYLDIAPFHAETVVQAGLGANVLLESIGYLPTLDAS